MEVEHFRIWFYFYSDGNWCHINCLFWSCVIAYLIKHHQWAGVKKCGYFETQRSYWTSCSEQNKASSQCTNPRKVSRWQTSKHLIYPNTQNKMHLETSLLSFYFVPGMLIFELFGKFAAITVSFTTCFLAPKICPLFSSQQNEHKRRLQCVRLSHKGNDTVPLNLIEPFCGWTRILGKVPLLAAAPFREIQL